jgi:hypothetical protein
MQKIFEELDTIAYKNHDPLGILAGFKLTVKSLMGKCDKKDRDHYEEIIYKRMHSFDKMKGDKDENSNSHAMPVLP